MENFYNLNNYAYTISQDLIAQEPLATRDGARLLCLRRQGQSLQEMIFRDIFALLEPEDVLVLNNTKVIKARLVGRKKTGARLDFLLLGERGDGIWEVLVKPSKRARQGDLVMFSDGDDFCAEILEATEQGKKLIRFHPRQIHSLLEKYGKVPLPPYIKTEIDEETKYQTIFATQEGAIAAPTAGFHFTEELLERLRQKKVHIVYITLHCGTSTFRPVKTSDIRNHIMDKEVLEISSEAARVINQAKQRGKRVFAVGTTSVRALESAAVSSNRIFQVVPQVKETSLYIMPGYTFKIVDALVTNFHTPCSTNLILIASFCGLDLTHQAYRYAIAHGFRFYSFGDAMAIL